ncbi:hypothetical protein CkaCkLH20_03895 [Colletotrichum karsti]|uniref:NACHT domain-containing protein n=1 Tax=Colletotrichum karsti TaxID=1095194 RepID=A0A9P6I8P2_9PEZI|nr:uncharacterized protein CkaCkLH20_03895 [Colletotrichum karsti]KAF9878403.1 hypothetical protein CkaCkLH20_03895 [Colletotrichum karsti]
MSRDLEELRRQFRQHLADQNTDFSATVTEAIVKQFKDRVARLTESNNALLADRIVSSLNYDSRPVRHDSVLQAHKDTFQWAFDSRLSDWLSSESGIFWVSGKPGSGKSTFMKFIAKSPRTKELLVKWAGSPEKLAVATHFFWIAGTPIQKSWQGLLQSLLYDLLRGHPDVVSLTSPDRWEAAKAGQWQMAAAPWSVDELAVALRALASASCVPLKMCFFIDGLDEYDSDHAELCRVLRDLASSTHIKICLSSRRWSVFEQSFGNGSYQNLDIHELTRDDIRKFVSDQLDIKSRWNVEMSQDVDDEMTQLVDRIAAQACGVFLWAFFVTRSLREDLSNGEEIGGLARRLSQLPSDLDRLFQHMLESVDPFDHSKMAGFLQAAAHALEPLHIDLYWHLEREFEGHGFGSRSAMVATTLEDISARREQTIRSINEKTKGLLRLVDNRVEFLHRTVKDFVLTKDVGEYLRSKLPANYDGFISITAAYLGFLRTKRTGHQLVADVIRQGRGMNSGPFIAHLNQALVYASEAGKQAAQSDTRQNRQVENLLDEYEAVIESMVSLGHINVKGVNSRGCHPKLVFHEELLRHDLRPYLAGKIRQHPDFFDMFDRSPLFAALMPMCRSSGQSSSPVPGVLDLLLQRGEDPNVQPRQRVVANEDDAPSPWVLFARSTMSVFNMLSGPCMFPALRWNESLKDATFGRLMSYGADPNMPLLSRPAARTVFSHFLDISLSKFLGEECFEDYLGTLDAFLRAGASLGVPDLAGKVDPDAGTAFGNLARWRPEESVLASFCSELNGLMARLAAEPRRAIFVSLVVEKLAMHCCREEDLRELERAVSQGCPDHTAAPLLRLIASKIMNCEDQGSSRKKRQNADSDRQFSIKLRRI